MNNRHRPCGKASPQISSRSRRQNFTFHCVFVAQKSTAGGPRVDFLLTELSFENHTQPCRWTHTKARWLNSARIRTGPVIRCCCFVCYRRRGSNARALGMQGGGIPRNFPQWRNFPQKILGVLEVLELEFGTGKAFHLRNSETLYGERTLSCYIICLILKKKP